MLIKLDNVLDADEFRKVHQQAQQAHYVPGSTTAGESSRSRKHNLQIAENDPVLPELQKSVLAALRRHPVLQFLAVPKHIMPPMFNRYDTGMHYQDHVDFSLVGANDKIRTDLSVTLFLSGRDEYDGGELIVSSTDGEQAVKLDRNEAIIYPAGQLHRVETVRRGSRLAAITTIQSFIRHESQRELLADLMRLARAIQDRAPQSDEARLANKIHANLLRLWAD